MEPLRTDPEFDATEYPTVPVPVPLAPLVIVTHEGLLTVHVQALPLGVTVKLPFPPPIAKLALVGETVYVQPA